MNRPSLSLISAALLAGLCTPAVGLSDPSGRRRGGLNFNDLVAPMRQGMWGVPWRSPASRGTGSVQNDDYLAGAWKGDGVASKAAKQKPRHERYPKYLNRDRIARSRAFRTLEGEMRGYVRDGDTVYAPRMSRGQLRQLQRTANYALMA